jgi:hypothetical protein
VIGVKENPLGNIAYCGLNCEACSFRVASLEKDASHLDNLPARYERLKPARIEDMELCLGCRHDTEPGPCHMRECAKGRGYSTCAECPEMPCEKLMAFCGDGAPHHGAVVENLKRIREIGGEAWALEQEREWRCAACGKRLSWYNKECPECDA